MYKRSHSLNHEKCFQRLLTEAPGTTNTLKLTLLESLIRFNIFRTVLLTKNKHFLRGVIKRKKKSVVALGGAVG